MTMIKLFSLSLFFLSQMLFAQPESNLEKEWVKYVNTEFELIMPVSKTNYRPVAVPLERSAVKRILNSVNAHDFLEYRGSNDEFFCTVQITAFEEEMSTEGVSTKLMQALKKEFDTLDNKDIVYESLEPIQNEKRIYLEYKGIKETMTFIMWISRKRVITVYLTDVNSDKKWTRKFLENFKVYE